MQEHGKTFVLTSAEALLRTAMRIGPGFFPRFPRTMLLLLASRPNRLFQLHPLLHMRQRLLGTGRDLAGPETLQGFGTVFVGAFEAFDVLTAQAG